MTTINIETLKAQLNAARTEAAAKMAERVEIAKMTAELNLLTNEGLMEAKAKMAVQQEAADKVAELILQCEAIVEDSPVIGANGQQRKFRASKRFGFGATLADLIGLLSGIQFSVADHNALMLAMTGLNKSLIEATLESLGQLSYYNSNHSVVVEGTVGNAEAIRSNLTMVCGILGIVVDVDHITQDLLEKQEELAKLKAEQAEAEAQAANVLQQFVIR